MDAHVPEIDIIGGVFALHSRFNDQLDTMKTEWALSRPERSVIINLQQPRRLGWLAQELLLVPSSLTVIADNLTKKGYVVREDDPTDRRAKRLRLTEKGINARILFEENASDVVRDVTGLNEDEILQLACLMRKVTLKLK